MNRYEEVKYTLMNGGAIHFYRDYTRNLVLVLGKRASYIPNRGTVLRRLSREGLIYVDYRDDYVMTWRATNKLKSQKYA